MNPPVVPPAGRLHSGAAPCRFGESRHHPAARAWRRRRAGERRHLRIGRVPFGLAGVRLVVEGIFDPTLYIGRTGAPERPPTHLEHLHDLLFGDIVTECRQDTDSIDFPGPMPALGTKLIHDPTLLLVQPQCGLPHARCLLVEWTCLRLTLRYLRVLILGARGWRRQYRRTRHTRTAHAPFGLQTTHPYQKVGCLRSREAYPKGGGLPEIAVPM